jgi:sec-independent protein translocase protein TatA
MGFSGIGIWEILLILIVALIVLGPGKLPGVARTLGKALRAIKKASADLTTAVTRELDVTQDEPPSQPKGKNKAETGEAPPAIDKANTPSRDDQPTKPGGAATAK